MGPRTHWTASLDNEFQVRVEPERETDRETERNRKRETERQRGSPHMSIHSGAPTPMDIHMNIPHAQGRERCLLISEHND